MGSAKAATSLLADRFITREGFWGDAARLAAATVLMILCAKIAVLLPWTPVPVTGQTFGVMLVAVLLGSRRGAIVLGLYLLEGLAGLPVFQPFGAPGPARFFGPTAGYLLSYPPAAFAMGWLVERSRGSLPRLVVALVAGEMIILAAGCAWLAAGMGLGWPRAFAYGVIPFLPGDLLKTALAITAVRGVEYASRKN